MSIWFWFRTRHGPAKRPGWQKQTCNGNRQERTTRCRAGPCLRSWLASKYMRGLHVPNPSFWSAPRSTPPSKLSLPFLPPPLHRCPPPIPLSLGRPLDPSISKAFLPLPSPSTISPWWPRAPLRSPEQATTSRSRSPAPRRPVGFIWCAASRGMAFHEVETPRRC